ncbi:molybdopterin-dependent oxidoreductase [Shewanella sp. 10N.286.45.A1]|uniref:nitrate reductase n=1 Tax=Shewanella sp. 10N.286.45.A1 TaxID=3229694 RepID=UPI003553177F
MPSCKTTCAYCGVGCGVKVEKVDRAEVGQASASSSFAISGDVEHSANSGDLCGKGLALLDSLNLPNKLLYPRIKNTGADYEDISWPKAISAVANAFNSTIAKYGSDSVAFYLSGQLLTEDYYVANKLAKGFIGTANVDTNSRLCMSSAVSAHMRAFGEDVVPGCYEDLQLADVVVLVGANTAWTHPVLFKKLLAARAERGTKLVVIDPRVTATASQADLHLQLTPGSDLQLFNGLLNAIVSNLQHDDDYIKQYTEGFSQVLTKAQEGGSAVNDIARHTGLQVDKIIEFYSLYKQSSKVVTASSQGVNQSTLGTNTSNAIINCHLALGDIGQPGCGPLSLTGQPNAMGGREVGGLATQLACHLGFSEEEHQLVANYWHTDKLANTKGKTATEMFAAMASGEIKAVWILGTNPVVSLPDTALVKQALSACDFVVVSDITADTDTAQYADILLPAQGWSEKSGTVTNSERTISRQRRFVLPQGDSKADWWALCEVAKALGFNAEFNFKNSGEIFKEYAQLSARVKQHFPQKQFSIAGLANLTPDQYQHLVPTQWPIDDIDALGQKNKRLFNDGVFATATGKAQFVETPFTSAITSPISDDVSSGSNKVRLNSGRTRDQWHTMTKTGHIAKLAAADYQPELKLNVSTSIKNGLIEGEFAALATDNLATPLIARVVIEQSIQTDSAFLSMHWSSQFSKSGGVNNVTSAAVDPHSKQPGFKNQWVQIKPLKVVEQGTEWGQSVVDPELLCWDVKQQLQGGFCRHIAADEDFSLSLSELNTTLCLSSAASVNGHVIQWKHQNKRVTCIVNKGRLKTLVITGVEQLCVDNNAIQLLINQIFNAGSIKKLHQILRAGSSQIVCACTGVTQSDIESQMLIDISGGADNAPSLIEKVQQKLHCSAVCGSCLNQVKEIADCVIAQKQRPNREVA